MKPYGNKQYDNIVCEYGCCTTKYLAPAGCRTDKRVKRRSRSKARQADKTEITRQQE
jgi:hypothetical protein